MKRSYVAGAVALALCGLPASPVRAETVTAYWVCTLQEQVHSPIADYRLLVNKPFQSYVARGQEEALGDKYAAAYRAYAIAVGAMLEDPEPRTEPRVIGCNATATLAEARHDYEAARNGQMDPKVFRRSTDWTPDGAAAAGP